MPGVDGFMYPNEVELQWSVLIVLYPFITGLVAGAFILASLERVFNVPAVKPTYRLALLTALAFLLVAPLPLQMHLGHPERSFEMMFTPHTTSAMAMFGFVYLWYLMVVLVVEIWLDYRRELVLAAAREHGLKRLFYRVLTLGSDNISPASLRIDDQVGRIVTIIGIPSAFLLHGYVGLHLRVDQSQPLVVDADDADRLLVFGDRVRHRPGAAAVRRHLADPAGACRHACVDTIATYLFYAFLVDFALEMIDLIHRIYEADESFRALDFMVKTRLFTSQIVLQIGLGTLVPIALLGLTQLLRLRDRTRVRIYVTRRRPDAGRHFCDALERRHRRAALFEELPRLHDVQDGLCDARRVAASDSRLCSCRSGFSPCS